MNPFESLEPTVPTDEAKQQARELKLVQGFAAQHASEKAASALRMAGEKGITVPAAEAQLEQGSPFDWTALQKDAPVLARHLVEDQRRAAAIGDDVEQLSLLEKLFRGWKDIAWATKESWQNTQRMTELGNIGWRQVNGMASPEDLARGVELDREDASRPPIQQGLVSGIPAASAQAAGQWWSAAGRHQPEIWGTALVGGVKGAAAGAAAGGVGAGPGFAGGFFAGAGVAVTAAGMYENGILEGGNAYREYIKIPGVSHEEAALSARLVALVNGAIEGIEADKVLGLVPGAKALAAGGLRSGLGRMLRSTTGRMAVAKLAGRISSRGLWEGLQEGMQEFVTVYEGYRAQGAGSAEALARLVGSPESRERIGEAAVGGWQMGVGVGLPGALGASHADFQAAREAQQRVAFYEALGDLSVNSKARERLPDVFKAYVHRIQQENEGVPEVIKAPAGKLTEVFQREGLTPDFVAKHMPEVARQLRDAEDPELEVAIPLADFTTHVAPLASYKELHQDLRIGEGMTLREAKGVEERAAELEAENAGTEGQAEPSPTQRVFEEVKQKSLELGHSEDVARKHAALWSGVIESRASRTGEDPYTYFSKLTLDVEHTELSPLQLDAFNAEHKKRAEAARARAAAQPAVPAAAAPAEKKLVEATQAAEQVQAPAGGLPSYVREEMLRRGLDPSRPLNDVDLGNASVREAIATDPSLTPEERERVLATGSPKAAPDLAAEAAAATLPERFDTFRVLTPVQAEELERSGELPEGEAHTSAQAAAEEAAASGGVAVAVSTTPADMAEPAKGPAVMTKEERDALEADIRKILYAGKGVQKATKEKGGRWIEAFGDRHERLWMGPTTFLVRNVVAGAGAIWTGKVTPELTELVGKLESALDADEVMDAYVTALGSGEGSAELSEAAKVAAEKTGREDELAAVKTETRAAKVKVKKQQGKRVTAKVEPVAKEPTRPPAKGTKAKAASPAAPAGPAVAEGGLVGTQGVLVTPQNPSGEAVTYAVVEASRLVPSHDAKNFRPSKGYPEGVQERLYQSSEDEQAKVKRGAEELNPAFLLTDTPSALDGPPVVTAAGEKGKHLVMGGNGRTMMVQRAFQDEAKLDTYRKALEAKAQAFGLDPAKVAELKAPVLVRVLPGLTPASAKEDLAAAVRRTNEGMTQALSVTARAVAEAKALTPETLEALSVMMAQGEGASLREVLSARPGEVEKALELSNVITPQNRSAWLAGGEFTEEAKQRLEGMFLGRVIGSGDRLERTAASLREKLERAAPYLVRVEGINPEASEIPTVQAALDVINDAVQRKIKLEDRLRQDDMLNPQPPVAPAVAAMARLLTTEKPKALALKFKTWAGQAGQDPNQSSMFGMSPANARQELLGKLEKVLYQRVKEQPKNLLVQHNLTAANLIHADELGGLPVPSIAIAKDQEPLTSFGEVTLLAPKELIDPAKGVPVFNADVYSPRFPDTRWKLNPRRAIAFQKWFKPFADLVGVYLSDFENELGKEGPENQSTRHDWRAAFALAYLAEQGKTVEPVVGPAKLEVGHYTGQPAMAEFLREHGRDPYFEMGSEYHRALSKAMDEAIRQHVAEVATAMDWDEARQAEEVKGWKEDYFGDDGLLYFGRTATIFRDLEKVGKTEIDKYATEDKVNELVREMGLEDTIRAWSIAKLEAVTEGRFIAKWNGGESPGWRLKPMTMANIVKEMTRNLRAAEGGIFMAAGATRAKGAKKFRTIEGIQKARDQIVTSDQFTEQKQTFDEHFGQVAAALRPYHPAGGDFGFLETVMDAIGGSYQRGRYLGGELRAVGFKDVPAELVQQVAELAAELRAMPTEYFEAKPQRAVGLNEFVAAVVREDVDPKALEVLKRAGLQVYEYAKAEDDADQETIRKRAIARAAGEEKILFQRDTTDPGPALVVKLQKAASQEAVMDAVLRQESAMHKYAQAGVNVAIPVPRAFTKSIRQFWEDVTAQLDVMGKERWVAAVTPEDALEVVRAAHPARITILGLKLNSGAYWRLTEQIRKEAPDIEIVTSRFDATRQTSMFDAPAAPAEERAAEPAKRGPQMTLFQKHQRAGWKETKTVEELRRMLASAEEKLADGEAHEADLLAGRSVGPTHAPLGYLREKVDEYRERIALAERGGATPAKGQMTLLQDADILEGDEYALEQRGAKPEQGEGYRGKVGFDESRSWFKITLTGRANLSTFLHESGHVFLELLRRDAQGGDAGAAADIRTLEEWLGLRPGEAWTDPQLEQFARAFEAYLMDGKAPSSALAEAFAAFRAWLVYIYKTIRGLDVQVTDEVRGVMDRLVATDDAIQKAAHDNLLLPLFPEAKGEHRMTGLEYEAYRKKWNQAIEAGRVELERQAMTELRRSMGAEAAKVRDQVQADVNTRPDYNAWAWLSTGKRLDGKAIEDIQGKLDLEAIRQMKLGAGAERKLKPVMKVRGIDPEVAAPFLGFDSGVELVQALVDLQPMGKTVQAEVTSRMKEKYPGFDGSAKWMAEKANEAINNDKVADAILLELGALNKQTGGEGGKSLHEAMKVAAARRVARMTGLELEPFRFRKAAAVAASEAQLAMGKGDLAGAANGRRRQLWNLTLERLVRDAKEETERIRWYLDSFSGLATRKRIGKAGQAYLGAIDALLEDIEFKRRADRTLERRRSLAEYLAEIEAKDPAALIAVPEELRNQAAIKNYRLMTFEELQGIEAAVANIDTQASLKNKLRIRNEWRDLEQTATAIKDHIVQVAGVHYGEGATQNPTWWEERQEWLRKGRAALTKVEFICRALDGGNTAGFFHRHVFQPLRDAQKAKEELNEKVMTELLKPFRQFSIADRIRLDRTVDFLGTKMKFSEVLAVALNIGNESNLEKLVGGYAYRGWTRQQVLDRLDELLEERDWKVVQHIWDTIDTLWPLIKALQERAVGLAPPRIEARSVVTKWGIFRGGYYPVVYDRRRAGPVIQTKDGKKAKLRSPEEIAQRNTKDMFEGGNFLLPNVSKGFTEARVKYVAPILLTLDLVPAHINEVIHFLTHYEAIRDVDRLTQHPDVEAAIKGALGREVYNLFRPWLQAIAKDGYIHESADFVDETLRHLRTGASIFMLGLKATTAIVQIFGLFPTAKDIGVGYTAKGVKTFFDEWQKTGDPFKRAEDDGAEIRYLTKHFDRDLGSLFDSMTSSFGAYAHAKERIATFSLAWIMMVQKTVNAMTWYGAFEKASEEGHANPADYADSIVSLTQSSGGVKDLAAIQRGTETKKLFTVMYTYFSTLFGQLTEAMPNKPPKEKVAIMAARWWWLVFLPVLCESLLRNKEPEKQLDGDSYAKMLARENLLYISRTMPLVGSVAEAMFSEHEARVNPWLNALLKGAAASAKGVRRGELTRQEKKALLELLGMATHTPTGGLMNGAKYLEEYTKGHLKEPVMDLFFRGPREWE